MRHLALVLSCVMTVAATASAAGAADGPSDVEKSWGRFRGPNGQGVSDATKLPIDFGPDKHVLWKTELPPGHSSPVLTANRIFLTAHTPDKEAYKLFVIGLDRKTGKQLWPVSYTHLTLPTILRV